jgi:hypothetical protein
VRLEREPTVRSLHEVAPRHSFHFLCKSGPIRRLQVLDQRIRECDVELSVRERQSSSIRLHVTTVGGFIAGRRPIRQVDPGYPTLRLELGKSRRTASYVQDGLIRPGSDQVAIGLLAPAPRALT